MPVYNNPNGGSLGYNPPPYSGATVLDLSATDATFDHPPRGIYCVTAGNLHLEGMDGTTPAAFAVTAGQTVPVRARKVVRVTTTAAVMALW